jgi:hypothetical protein
MQVLFALPFLTSGCIVFITCAIILKWRRFALPGSLWCVALGPSFLISLLIFGLIYKMFGLSDFGASRYVVIAAGVLSSAVASIVAFAHNQIMALLSDRLFRLYVTGVSFGVGMLFASILVIAQGIASIRIPAPVVINTAFVILTGLAFAIFTFPRSAEFRKSMLI